jgi:eukaryotic-like serine/threonine-protein kinase
MSMPDPRLESLLDRYQDMLDAGRTPNLDSLCRDAQDLRAEVGRQVARLDKVGQLLGDRATPPDDPEPELSLTDDKTWVSHPGGHGAPVEIPAPSGYEVLAPLGEGGMGVVYKARQVGLDRLVALKMILAGSRARHVDLARFRDEAQSIASLRHPNIVQVFEIGEFRGLPFFSLEFCTGGSLARALHGEPQPPVAAAGMAEVLARAVHYAHSRGIVHRDLKPGNVLLSAEVDAPRSALSTHVGDPQGPSVHPAVPSSHAALKITDFGLAKRVDDDSRKTLDGSVMGTPAYMAPEQAMGDNKSISPATDVYALGAMLYEFLTGRPPFKGSTVHDTLEQVRHWEPAPVRTLQPKVPVDLETICLKCLQKDQKKRYQTAQDLADDLRRFLDGRAILGRPIGHIVRAWRWCRREPRAAVRVVATTLLLVVIPALVVGYNLRLRQAEELLEQQRILMAAAINSERIAREAAENQRYTAFLCSAAQLRIEHPPGWTWAAREQVAAAARAINPSTRDTVALRSEMAAALGAIDLRATSEIGPKIEPGAIAFASDGRLAIAPLVAQPVSVQYVLLLDPTTGEQHRLDLKSPLSLKRQDRTTTLAFSPDGQWLFLALRNGSIIRWDLNRTPEPLQSTWEAHGREAVAGFAFSPDSRWVFTAGHDGRVKRWPIAGNGMESKTWPAGGDKFDRVTGISYWTGPQSGILIHGHGGTRLIDPETMTERCDSPTWNAQWVAPAVTGSNGRLAVHPATGTIVVSRGGEVEVNYWECGIHQVIGSLIDPSLEEPKAHDGMIEAMAVHPSGILLATICPSEGLTKVWHLGRMELAVVVPSSSGQAVAFSPDGTELVVAGHHHTTRYEIGGLSEQTYLGRRGLTIRTIGRTSDGLIATIAGRSDTGAAVASIWDNTGKLVETILHRSAGPVVTGEYRVAACPKLGLTGFHAGDSEVIWRDLPGKPRVNLDLGLKKDSHFDLDVDPTGQCWAIEGGSRLVVRTAGSTDKARPLAIGSVTGGRKDLMCVRSAGDGVVVGCEDGFLRVLRANGTVAKELPCFDWTLGSFFMESANTVHSVAVTDEGSHAIAGTEDGRLWHFRLPDEKLQSWEAHSDRVTSVACDRTGEWVASGGRDRMVKLWRRTANGYELYLTLRSSGTNAVRQVLFSSDGERLLVLHERETAVRVWHLARLWDRFVEADISPLPWNVPGRLGTP